MKKLTSKKNKKAWTSDEVKKLKYMYDAGVHANKMADKLGRTRSSIYKAIARFQLTHESRRRQINPPEAGERTGRKTAPSISSFYGEAFDPHAFNMDQTIQWFRQNCMTNLEIDRKRQTAHLVEINYHHEDMSEKYFENHMDLVAYINLLRHKGYRTQQKK